tara:strand:+ start:693 stop:1097 length:405 start_codon:yes stop_codon:yes gene_type:complete
MNLPCQKCHFLLRILVAASFLQFIVTNSVITDWVKSYHAVLGVHLLLGITILILSYAIMFLFKKNYSNCFGATALSGAITLQFIIGLILYLSPSSLSESIEQIIRLLHITIGLAVLSLAVALRVRFAQHKSNSK